MRNRAGLGSPDDDGISSLLNRFPSIGRRLPADAIPRVLRTTRRSIEAGQTIIIITEKSGLLINSYSPKNNDRIRQESTSRGLSTNYRVAWQQNTGPCRYVCTYPRGSAALKNALRAATDRPYFAQIHNIIYREAPSSSFIIITIIRMEALRPITTAIELQVENPISIFQFPTPTLEYLAHTKQSDVYRSLGMDRRRKNLLVNSLYPAPGGKWSAYEWHAKLCGSSTARCSAKTCPGGTSIRL